MIFNSYSFLEVCGFFFGNILLTNYYKIVFVCVLKKNVIVKTELCHPEVCDFIIVMFLPRS